MRPVFLILLIAMFFGNICLSNTDNNKLIIPELFEPTIVASKEQFSFKEDDRLKNLPQSTDLSKWLIAPFMLIMTANDIDPNLGPYGSKPNVLKNFSTEKRTTSLDFISR